MHEQIEKRAGKQIPLGVFVFVTVVLCLTAIFGTGIDLSGTTTQTIHPGSPASPLADTVVERNLAPELDEAMLRRMVQAIMERAAAGDIEATAFVFEMAARQRASHDEASEDPATPKN